jgi:enamine deaminase RidA (YjgF/YER057c/UK114 family)
VQTRHVLESIKSVLAAAGGNMSDIAFNQIFLKDLADYVAMNEVYREYFPANPPARYCIRAELVKPEFLVEIASTAHLAGRAAAVAAHRRHDEGRRLQSSHVIHNAFGNRGDVRDSAAADGDCDALAGADGLSEFQTRHVLESIKSVLAAAGGNMSDIAFNQIFLKDLADYAAMNEVYREYFPANPPARYCIRAELVKPEFLVEIASTAHLAG